MLKSSQIDNLSINKENFKSFNHSFISPKGLTFAIRPLTIENLEENSIEITKCFRHEPLSQTVDYDYELEVMRRIAKKSLKEQIGISCYEKTTGKWAGCLLSEDFSTSLSDPCNEYDGKYDFVIDFLSHLETEGFKKLGLTQSQNKYEQIHINCVGVAKEFWGNKILNTMTKFYFCEHPIVKSSKIIFAETTNIHSRSAMEAAGMKIVYSINYSDLVQREEMKKYNVDYRELLKNSNKSEDEVGAFNCFVRI